MSRLSDDAQQDPGPEEGRTVRTLRRLLLVILVLTLAGTFVDLMLMGHHEDLWQMIPLVLLGFTAMTLAWHGISGGAASGRAIQSMMVLVILGGVAGVVLHARASAEYYEELDATLDGWRLAWTVLRSKVPPILAPAVMLQMGLMGLIYTYRHPARRAHAGSVLNKGEHE